MRGTVQVRGKRKGLHAGTCSSDRKIKAGRKELFLSNLVEGEIKWLLRVAESSDGHHFEGPRPAQWPQGQPRADSTMPSCAKN